MALITARGGSKGLPRKNIRPLLGMPLMAWSIEQGLASRYLDGVIVSTDDEEIAAVARQCGAEIPFLRPAELASDEAKSVDVIAHALAFLKERGSVFDYLLLLEPTSPLREVSDIDTAIERLLEHPTAKALVSVAKLESGHPEFNVIIDEQTGCLRRMNGSADFKVLRRQELSEVFFLEGSIYLSETEMLLSRQTFYHELTLAYPVPRWKSLEIDELCDFICAEALLKARQEGLF
ncbi:MAG: acylneuraminate cytidylyltransferase family protein [Nitrospirota bacterium]